jgi:hypothetical protein
MTTSAPPARGTRSSEAGFSVLEGLIAAAILLFVLIGILPLFERARLNLLQGNDATQVTNAAIDGFDPMLSLPFNSFDTNVPAAAGGPNFEQVTTDSWALFADRWLDDITTSPVANDRAQFTRTIRLQQFQVSDFEDNGLLDTPLASNADGVNYLADIKRYTITITNERGRVGTTSLSPDYQLVVIQSN